MIDSVDVAGEGGDDMGEGETFRFVSSLRLPDAEEEQESLVDTLSPSEGSSFNIDMGRVNGKAVM